MSHAILILGINKEVKMKKLKMLLTTQNAKTSKGENTGYLTGILYMAPASISGVNLCQFASNGCKKSCLYSAGRGKFSNVQQARINKAKLFNEHNHYFMQSLLYSVRKLIKEAKNKNLIPCVRLNGTTDISWENIIVENGKNIFELFSDIQFYDYTKNFNRLDALNEKWLNYHLTFSRSESNDRQVQRMIDIGVNVAIVYSDAPKALEQVKNAINGDVHDLRFLDAKGKIVALSAKGDAKKDASNFVIKN